MKNFFKISAVVIFTAISTFIVSCAKDDDPVVTTPPDNTITAKAVATADLSILVAALTKTNLAATLKGAGPFTVFAPTNAAFTAAGISVATINNSTPAEVTALSQVLLNHVVSGSTTAAQLMDNTYLKTTATYGTTTSKLSMYVAKTAAGAVKLNKVSNVITTTDGGTYNIAASNGTIHLVDAVIGLPTIVTHATANPNFSGLVGLLTSPGQPAFTTILAGTGPFTVFAPTNTAVTAATTGTGFAVLASAAQVTRVLQYHVASGNNLAASLMDNTEITTIAPDPITSTIFQKLKVFTLGTLGARLEDKATAPNNISKIIITDVQCSNGVIHAVDKVLKPNL